VGAVEDKVTVAVRGDDDGVALNGLSSNSFTNACETRGIVVLVQDEARELDDAQGLGVAARAAEDEVEKQKATEEEYGDDREEPDYAHEQVQRVQKIKPPPRKESGRPDSNRRPLGPQPSALPDCATSRRVAP
jgi:hypothetical protein